jgi:hypothetical protein
MGARALAHVFTGTRLAIARHHTRRFRYRLPLYYDPSAPFPVGQLDARARPPCRRPCHASGRLGHGRRANSSTAVWTRTETTKVYFPLVQRKYMKRSICSAARRRERPRNARPIATSRHCSKVLRTPSGVTRWRPRLTSASSHLSRLQGRIKLTGFNYPQLLAAGVPTQTPSVEGQAGILHTAFKRHLEAGDHDHSNGPKAR